MAIDVNMRFMISCACLVWGCQVNGQVIENFDDGNFADGVPLIWIASQTSGGDDFVITSGEVQSNGPAATGDLYLSTNLGIDFANNDVVWTFKTRYTSGGPSSGNRIEVYLISDVLDVTGSPNGYYIGMGESGSTDGIDLFKTGTSTAIINDDNDLVGAGIDIHVRVTRSSAGVWTLEADASGGDSFSLIGSVSDSDITSGDFFGFRVKHTSTRNQDYFFDDFTVTVSPIPDTIPPIILSAEASSDTQVDIRFSEKVDAATAQNAANYLLDGGVSVLNAVQEVDSSLIHLITTPLTNGTTYALNVHRVEDIMGNPMADTLLSFRYLVTEKAEPGDIVINEFIANTSPETSFPEADFVELYNKSGKFIQLSGWTVKDNSLTGISDTLGSYVLEPNAYVIITDIEVAAGFGPFGNVLGVDNFPNFNSTTDDAVIIRDSSEKVLAEVSYSPSVILDGVSLELINPNDPCISIFSYTLSTDPAGGTPGIENSVFDSTPDTTPPTVSSYGYTTSLVIHFSEVMDSSSLVLGSYMVSGGLIIDQVLVDERFPTSVEIVFEKDITLGQSYTFTLAGMSDCWGNTLLETTLSFAFGRSPGFNELIITEIMYDEVPSVGLPEREYIEIYNASSSVLSTEGVQLMDATGTATLPAFNINPGDYYVLTSSSGASDFSKAAAVSGFPSLSNGGEQLVLFKEDTLIFSITYSPDWHEENRSDGGFSLEMIDLTSPCVESGANWTSSISTIGGTPGMINSVYKLGATPDHMSPSLINVVALSADSVALEFDEKLSPESMIRASYILKPPIGIRNNIMRPQFPQTIFITLNKPLKENTRYTAAVEGVVDCNGNEGTTHAIEFALPIQASEGEILLSEVLFNPRTNGVDFVELYNNSDNFLSLKDWQLARLDVNSLDDQVIISEQELVINPHDFLVLTENPDVLLNNYPKGAYEKFLEVRPFPTYANDTGNVVLVNAFGEISERFFYDESYHYRLLESVDGVSLERVSYNDPTNDPNNWRSASSTVGFATPGLTNSQSRPLDTPSGVVVADPKVFIPGNAGSGRDFTLIKYQFDKPGKFANVIIYDQAGRQVKNLAEGALLSTTGFLRWDGDTNNEGMARMGYYLVLFEIYDSNGNTEIIKETVVVGRDF